MIVSTEAVVLHAMKYGDTSKIVNVFTRDFGKISLMAKGARQAKNKFGSALEPLSYIEITFYNNNQRDMQLLSKAELVVPVRRIQESNEHLSAGLSILESVEKSQHEHEKNSDIFDSLVRTLTLLNELGENPHTIFVWFQLFLAGTIGFGLSFDDVSGDDLLFSLDEGRVIRNKNAHVKNSLRISGTVAAKLSNILELSLETSYTVFLDEKSRNEIIDLLKRYFSFHLEKSFYYRSYNLLVKHDGL